MGMFDYIKFDGVKIDECGETAFQSKDGPCALLAIDRDAVDQYGAYLINLYYGDGTAFRRGPNGWVEVDRRARREVTDS